jgi:hypothetical protein
LRTRDARLPRTTTGSSVSKSTIAWLLRLTRPLHRPQSTCSCRTAQCGFFPSFSNLTRPMGHLTNS